MVEFNPAYNVDNLFINYNSNQKYHQTGTAKVDSTNYSKDIHTQSKVARQQATTQTTTQGTNPQKPQTTGKPKPKPPVVPKPEKIDISAGQKVVGEEEHGFFHTNLPVFESANITEPKPPYATTNDGVEIYIAGDNNEENPVILTTTSHGNTEITFKNSNIKAIIPPQANPKDTMIVYNPETQTMVFNNIEGIKIKSKINDDWGGTLQNTLDQTKGAGNILVNGGSVASFNTAEISRYDGFIRENSSQNIVFNNTKVAKFDVLNDLYITLGDTEIQNANNHPEFKNKGGDTTTYWATDGKSGIASRAESTDGNDTNGNGQSYYTVAQGLKWINNGQDATNIDTEDTRGSINVDNDVMKIKFDNVPVCRKLNGVNIYIKGGDAKAIRNRATVDGSGGFIDFNGTTIQFPPQPEGKNANIYYDAETQTLVFENIDGLDVNYSDKQASVSTLQGFGMARGAETAANIYIRNCHCKHVNFMEREPRNDSDFKLGSNAEKSRSNIMIDEKSKVDELLTYKDNVYIHSGADIEKYAGIETNVHGQDLTGINAFGSDDIEKNGEIKSRKRNRIKDGEINSSDENTLSLLPKILRSIAYIGRR